MIALIFNRSMTCLAIAIGLATLGCQGAKIPSIPLLDDMGLLPDDAVPAEVAARYGPTAADRTREIDRLGAKAVRASATEQQTISQTLANQIRTEDDPFVRERIVRAITPCRTPLGAAVLRAALEDDDLDVRLAAIGGWGLRGGDEAVTHLGRLVGDTAEELDVRLAAATAMGQFKHATSPNLLASALESTENPALQFRAMQSLQKITGQDHGNDLVAWRQALGAPSGERVVDRGPTREVSPPESSPSLAERALFWWR